MENIPFDIASNNRIILYKSPEDLEQKLSTYLKELPDANKWAKESNRASFRKQGR